MKNIKQETLCLIYKVNCIKSIQKKRHQIKEKESLFQITIEEWKQINSNQNEAMILRYQKTNNPDLLNKIINQNYKLIHHTIRVYNLDGNSRLEYEDLEQEGYIGLIKSVYNFKASKKSLFSTYAINYIKGYIMLYIDRNSNGSLAISLHGAHLLKKYKKNEDNIDDKELKSSFKNIAQIPVYLDAPVKSSNNSDGDNNNGQDICPSDSTDLFDNVEFNMLWEEISLSLTSRQKEILEYYLQGYTWVEIGKMLNVSASSVWNTGKTALKKLKNKHETELRQLL